MSVRLSLAGGGTITLRLRGDRLELAADRRLLQMSREEAWRLAEAIDRLATAADER